MEFYVVCSCNRSFLVAGVGYKCVLLLSFPELFQHRFSRRAFATATVLDSPNSSMREGKSIHKTEPHRKTWSQTVRKELSRLRLRAINVFSCWSQRLFLSNSLLMACNYCKNMRKLLSNRLVISELYRFLSLDLFIWKIRSIGNHANCLIIERKHLLSLSNTLILSEE